MRKALLALGIAAPLGCVPPVSPGQLLADSAYDMNTATRFGRMDVALEHVGPAAQEDFTKRHEGWGRDKRIVDVELTGLRMRASDEADVTVSVMWQRPDEAHVRFTQLAQRWQDGRGGWRMTSEELSGGDVGLLGERAGSAAPQRVGYQTKAIAPPQ
jgi:hypothetical protein